jgi:hypothetical protein
MRIWAAGRVEVAPRGQPFLKVDREGPGQHAARVWEDWLAELAAPVYDLYPGEVCALWEVPQTRREALLDILTRTHGGARVR